MKQNAMLVVALMAAGVVAQMLPPRLEWDVDVANPQPKPIGLFQGETLELQPRYLWGGRVVQVPDSAAVRLWLRSIEQTNVSYYIDGDVPASGTNGKVRVVVKGEYAIPTGNFYYWIEVKTNATASLRATGTMVVRPGVSGEGAPPPLWEPLTTGTVWDIVQAESISNVELDGVLGVVSGRVARLSEADPLAYPVATNALAAVSALDEVAVKQGGAITSLIELAQNGGFFVGQHYFLTPDSMNVVRSSYLHADRGISSDGTISAAYEIYAGNAVQVGAPPGGLTLTEYGFNLGNGLVVLDDSGLYFDNNPVLTNAYLAGVPGAVTGSTVYLTAPAEADPVAYPVATNALTKAQSAITNVVIGLSTGTVAGGIANIATPRFGDVIVTNRVVSRTGHTLMTFSAEDIGFRNMNLYIDVTGFRPLVATRTLGIPNTPWGAVHTRGLQFHGGWNQPSTSVIATNITDRLSLASGPTNWLVTASAVTNVLRDSAVLQNGTITGSVALAQGAQITDGTGRTFLEGKNGYIEASYLHSTGSITAWYSDLSIVNGTLFCEGRIQSYNIGNEPNEILGDTVFAGTLDCSAAFITNAFMIHGHTMKLRDGASVTNIATTLSRTTARSDVLVTGVAVSNYLAGGTAVIVLPSNASGLPSGALWNDNGTIRVVP